MSELESLFDLQVRAAGLPEPKCEYKFHPSRKFRADRVWVEHRLIVEIMGGTHVAHTGHTSHSGLHRDYEKTNLAQLMGFTVLQFDREMIEDGSAIDLVREFMDRGEQ